MISVKTKGNFKKTTEFLVKTKKALSEIDLARYGELALQSLKDATPTQTGLTAESWFYTVKKTSTGQTLAFHNSNVQNDIPVVILLQYGHATPSGVWVEGVDFINPALEPIIQYIVNDIKKEVM